MSFDALAHDTFGIWSDLTLADEPFSEDTVGIWGISGALAPPGEIWLETVQICRLNAQGITTRRSLVETTTIMEVVLESVLIARAEVASATIVRESQEEAEVAQVQLAEGCIRPVEAREVER